MLTSPDHVSARASDLLWFFRLGRLALDEPEPVPVVPRAAGVAESQQPPGGLAPRGPQQAGAGPAAVDARADAGGLPAVHRRRSPPSPSSAAPDERTSCGCHSSASAAGAEQGSTS